MNRIGIDATAIPPKPVGAGTYSIELIKALLSFESDSKFTIFARRSSTELLDNLHNARTDWILVKDRKPGSRLIWEQIDLPSVVQKSGIRLLHSLHYTRPMRLPCLSVVTFHDMSFFLFPQYHTLPKRFLFPQYMRLSARLADHIIAVSETTRNDTVRLLNVSTDKISTIHQGVSKVFHPLNDASLLESTRKKYSLPQEFLLYVGTVEPRKNLSILLKAFKNLLDRGQTLPLVVVGLLGWGYQDFFNRIKDLKLDDKLILTGYIPSADLPIIYNLAKIFIYPSIYEGFGLPPLEAMASGTPVISTTGSAIEEHVGDAGLLVSPYDDLELTNAMETLILDQGLQETLIAKGLERSAKFTWNRTAQETLKLYHQILSRN